MAASRDSALVKAARHGDQQARDELAAAYLPLVYNIVGRALNAHADVDDVVQESMIRALGSLDSLRHPKRFRSWLVAITMNQVRTYWGGRSTAPDGAGLQDAYDLADPGADFEELTIVRLGLEGQRREVAKAARWLDADDRELLSLWWLEATGELERAEVAAALELSRQHTAVRVQRMKARLETARLVVRALSAQPRCVLLDDAIATWDGTPSALWRKRIARHGRDCTVCSGHEAELVPTEGLLMGLALVPIAGLAGFAADGGLTYPDHGGDLETVGPDTPVLRPTVGSTPADRRSRRIQSRAGQRRNAVVAAAALLITAGTAATTTMLSPDEEKDSPLSATAADTLPASPTAPTGPSAHSPSPSKSPTSSPSKTSKPARTTPAAAPSPTRTATRKPAPPPKPPTDPADTPAGQVLAITNTERAKAGCRPLKLDERLIRAAQLHSEDMSANGYFDHTGLDGRNFADRAMAQGYESPGAENIARGQNSPESVMASWMSSEGHRNNILNCSLTTMGLGVTPSDWTWTQVFGF